MDASVNYWHSDESYGVRRVSCNNILYFLKQFLLYLVIHTGCIQTEQASLLPSFGAVLLEQFEQGKNLVHWNELNC